MQSRWIAIMFVAAVVFLGLDDWRVRTELNHKPIVWTPKEYPVMIPDPHMTMAFGKDSIFRLELVDQKGRIYETISPNNGKLCSFGENLVTDCSFDGPESDAAAFLNASKP